MYPTHKTEGIIGYASDLDIEIIFIPPGATGVYQPLDFRIIGELKSRSHKEFELLKATTGTRDITHEQSTEILSKSWERILSMLGA